MNDTCESLRVPPKVNFREWHFTDRPFAVAYALSYIGFLSCGFYIVSQARDRYTVDENGIKIITLWKTPNNAAATLDLKEVSCVKPSTLSV